MRQPAENVNPETLSLGTAIEVRNHFCAIWCTGFEVAGSTDTGYLVRRISDRYVLPLSFPTHEVRRHS